MKLSDMAAPPVWSGKSSDMIIQYLNSHIHGNTVLYGNIHTIILKNIKNTICVSNAQIKPGFSLLLRTSFETCYGSTSLSS